MSYMTDPGYPDQIVPLQEPQPKPAPAGGAQIRLRRLGARPLVFHGSELGMAMSFSPELPYWYEINLYRTTDQDFVLAVRLFHQSEEERDTVEAWRFASLADAMDALESYDAARDVKVTVNPSDPTLSAAELVAHAMDLRGRAEAARRHFSGLVGEFLHQMDAAA